MIFSPGPAEVIRSIVLIFNGSTTIHPKAAVAVAVAVFVTVTIKVVSIVIGVAVAVVAAVAVVVAVVAIPNQDGMHTPLVRTLSVLLANNLDIMQGVVRINEKDI